MVLYILIVFILDKYIPMHTQRHMHYKRAICTCSEKLSEIFIFHILAQHSSQATRYPAEIPFIICKLSHNVLLVIVFDIKIKMLTFSVSPFLAYVPQEDLAAHRSQMVA